MKNKKRESGAVRRRRKCGVGEHPADPELGCICSQRFRRRRQGLKKTDGGRAKADAAHRKRERER